MRKQVIATISAGVLLALAGSALAGTTAGARNTVRGDATGGMASSSTSTERQRVIH
jgi:hypothetical protein